ncbi:hypothetical protein C1280_15535 [Gemmata obscuriglobus]|uniref:Uncharacterized protein n=1 Tax=Gemmata obscuriglobus TaxID=114 RepID=A0A2Z3GV07_9BACT|nr:hypothetical protein C1280_15535 [Gemmata obscuriglobus]
MLLVLVQTCGALGSEPERLFKVVPQRGFPAVESVTLYQTRNSKREKVADVTAFEKPTQLPSAGPFEVWVRCKGGTAVKALDALSVKEGATHELKLGELFGTVEVFGDNLPRAEKIVLTDPRDPGPGEKNHVAVQVATAYRVELCVPPGVYAVWVVPANGGRAQRVEDNVRVQAGRSVRVGD